MPDTWVGGWILLLGNWSLEFFAKCTENCRRRKRAAAAAEDDENCILRLGERGSGGCRTLASGPAPKLQGLPFI